MNNITILKVQPVSKNNNQSTTLKAKMNNITILKIQQLAKTIIKV